MAPEQLVEKIAEAMLRIVLQAIKDGEVAEKLSNRRFSDAK